MKKLILIGLLGVMVTSCQKEYVCECTMYWGFSNTVGSVTQTSIKKSKSKALSQCKEKEVLQDNEYSSYTKCNLK